MARVALVIAAVVLAASATAAPPAWSDNPSCPSRPEAGSWVKDGDFKANSQLARIIQRGAMRPHDGTGGDVVFCGVEDAGIGV